MIWSFDFLLLIDFVHGFKSFQEGARQIQALLSCTLMTLILYSFSWWTNQLAKREIKKVTIDRTNQLMSSSCILFQVDLHWLKQFHFFSLEGQRLAYAKENVKENWQIWKLPLHLLGIRGFLPIDYTFYVDQKQILTITKAGEWESPLVLYNEKGKEIGRYYNNWRNFMRFDIRIQDPNGMEIASVEGGMGGHEFKVIDTSGKQLLFLRPGEFLRKRWRCSLMG
ncbi:hypothetical protein ACFFHM_12010 [Halalkalibacter kiskunsagensis]|uniref:Uncharacterized protein n=1 Tax=Halalkalibacter kiskunsagensis TaxID=1548599 RepID=A0ABV6KD04_9BACI